MIRILLALVLLGVASPASAAERAQSVQLNLLAFDKVLEKVLVRIVSIQGTSLQVREVYGNAKPKKGWFVESVAEERKKRKSLRRRFPNEANLDQMDPKGRVTIMGAPDGHRSYQILAMRDGRVGVLGKIPLEKNTTEVYAKGMLKEVCWLPNGRGVLVVVNQKVETDDGPYDVDRIHFFKFKIWKIKWIKPEGGDGKKESK